MDRALLSTLRSELGWALFGCAAQADITSVADAHLPPAVARDRHVVTNDSAAFVRLANPPKLTESCTWRQTESWLR